LGLGLGLDPRVNFADSAVYVYVYVYESVASAKMRTAVDTMDKTELG